MKEKTKAELLQELNEELENKIKLLKEENTKLVDEIRNAKSNVSKVEANLYKVDYYDKLEEEKRNIELSLASANKQLAIQDKQIGILINGLNTLNTDVNRLFDNVNYVLSLAKVNYDNNFSTIQNNLNNLIPKEEEIENGN